MQFRRPRVCRTGSLQRKKTQQQPQKKKTRDNRGVQNQSDHPAPHPPTLRDPIQSKTEGPAPLGRAPVDERDATLDGNVEFGRGNIATECS